MIDYKLDEKHHAYHHAFAIYFYVLIIEINMIHTFFYGKHS